MVHLTIGEVLAKKVLKGGFGGGGKSPLLIKSSGRCHPNKIGLNILIHIIYYYILNINLLMPKKSRNFHLAVS